MTVIAMTREMGSRGKEVASLLAERLASRLVYHELVEDAPDSTAVTSPSEVKRFLETDTNGPDRLGGRAERDGRMTPVELLELASRGNIIIRGWGAVRLLQTIPHVLCVRVCAPMQARVAEMVGRLGISERAARTEIERNDASHAGVFVRFFGDDWRDPLNYDLTLNTAKISPEECADLIVDVVAKPRFQETEESRRMLEDRLVEARIASFLGKDPRIRALSRSVYVSVSEGAVNLYGTAQALGAPREIEQAVREHTGVELIHNSIQTVGAYMDNP